MIRIRGFGFRLAGRGRLWREASPLVLAAVLVAGQGAADAQQLPTGGAVAAGSATIASPNASTLNINQSSNRAIINWQSFSVGQGNTVNFNQPSAAAATLNRVTGSTPSSIAGTINAPGTVLLVNPNGIAITKTGVVNVGSFAASTLDIKNEDFLAGKYKFTGNGGSAAVSNAGRINVSDGGFAALLGGQVSNSGVISARLGKVGLGAGELITLDFAVDGFLSVGVPSSRLGNMVDGSGALVSNTGKIRARGGQVYLSAATAKEVLRDAVNVPGSIRATSVGTRNGKIVIGGGAGGRVSITGRLAAGGGRKNSGGTVAVTGSSVHLAGKVDVSGKTGGRVAVHASNALSVAGGIAAKGRDGQGGRIELTGADVRVVAALIDASGTSGGGLVRIGGAFRGGVLDPGDPLHQAYVGRWGELSPLASAQTAFVDAQSRIDVSARHAGDAGTAIVWSDQATAFAGHIAGTGGASGGSGGYAEVSGKEFLDFTGTIDLRAAAGATGTLLLDPRNVTISTGTNSNGSLAGGTYTPTGNNAVLNINTLLAALATGHVNVTTGSSGNQQGNITVSTAITWTSGNNLTLTAANNISINAAINAGTGSLILSAERTVSQNASGAITALGLALVGTDATFTLNNTSNSVQTLSANADTVSFFNSANLAIGSVGGTNGVTAATLNLNVADGRTVTQTQAIAATNLSLQGASATYTLTHASNAIGTFAADVAGGTVSLTDTGGLVIDRVNSINGVTAQTLTLTNDGAVTQSAVSNRRISVTNLELRGTGGSYTLTNGSNAIGTLAANTGSVNVASDTALEVGTVSGTAGVTAAGAVTVSAAGNLTIAAAARVSAGADSDVVLSTTANFTNNRGGDAVSVSGTGRWLIYSAAPTGNVFGGLDSGNTAVWNATLATLPPGSVSAAGNRYLFALQPTLTFTSTDVSKTYGDTADLSGAFAISGLQNGVANAFLADTAAGVYSGSPSVTSAGSPATAGVAGSPYVISVAAGTVAALNGYAFAFNSAGQLTVNARPLTVTANDQSKIYGNTFVFAGTEFTTNGLVNGDTVTSATLTSAGAAATAGVAGSPYAIVASNAQGSGLGNYAITYVGGGMTVNPRPLTITANDQSKVYGNTFVFGGTEFTTSGLVNGDTVTSATLTSAGAAATAGVAGSPYGIQASNPQGSGLGNYVMLFVSGGLTVTPRPITVTADGQSKVYGSANPPLSYQVTAGNLVNGDTLAGALATAATTGSGVGTYAITQNTLTSASNPNYAIGYVAGSLTVTPATLTYVANPASRDAGVPNPAFTGTVTGFVNGETLATATTGALQFTSPADAFSLPARYAIAGSGLAAANYVFVQAPGNATALTVDPAKATTLTSQGTPPGNAPPSQGVNITFQDLQTEPTPISLTPGGNIVTRGNAPALTYPPISQRDPNQYSQFRLPGDVNKAGLAAVFAMLARAADPSRAANFMIDTFWNGGGADWSRVAQTSGLNNKVIFSNGAGNNVTPNEGNGFPIVPGQTDLAALLRNGPVVIGGAAGDTPPVWLLATRMTDNGRGIIANDPISGRQVVLAYDPSIKTAGGITGIFDTNTPLVAAPTSAGAPPLQPGGLAALQGFVPATFFAVTVK